MRLADVSHRAAMGAAGWAWVRDHFAMEQIAARYVEFYGQVLGRRRGKA